LTILFVSQGTPMLLYGDEIRRTQGGNNNAYCQDNETSWFNWSDVERQQELLRFTKLAIRFNRSHPMLNLSIYPQNTIQTSKIDSRVFQCMTWHGVKLYQPDWGHYSHSIALTLNCGTQDDDIHMMFNAYKEDLEFELPPRAKHSPWLRAIDTNRPSPDDFVAPGQERPIEGNSVVVGAHSVMILIAHN
jgi:glycogen operon protein